MKRERKVVTRTRELLVLCACLCAGGFAARAGAQDELLRTDSRAPYVHRISLYDHEGEVIAPGDDRPYSPSATCGKCHPVGQIAGGWHFNAGREGVDAGRPGEPWIWTDAALGVQAPISARGWAGTFTPEQVGLSAWEFVKRFGGHTPGGGQGAPDEDAIEASDEALRWGISGRLEIDCLMCHSAAQAHDPAEQQRQIEHENLRWAPTAALGLGVVRGEARKLPDEFDPLFGPNPDRPEQRPPQVVYDATKFDPDDRVHFDLTTRIAAQRCYFCHSFRQVGPGAPPRWHSDGDVHVRAGMTCVDCHRNGIDHMITRGYEGEPAAEASALPQREATPDAPAARQRGAIAQATTLTCRGCHLGDGPLVDAPRGRAGRLGAPFPRHEGIPLVHFEKMSCTACHSGPWPQDAAARFQTAMNHGLGLPTRERTGQDWPTILAPIYARDAAGRVAPQRMIWPAYWGVRRGEAVEPLTIEAVTNAGRTALRERTRAKHAAQLGPLRDEEIIAMLTALQAPMHDGTPVYVRDGATHWLADRELRRRAPSAAELADALPGPSQAGASQRAPWPGRPYLWPIGHDVRPASQSLGVRGCTDCHARDAAIYIGRLAATDEPGAEQRPLQRMHELRGDDLTLASAMSVLFGYRAWFKLLGLACAAVVALVLVRHGFAGLAPGSTTR